MIIRPRIPVAPVTKTIRCGDPFASVFLNVENEILYYLIEISWIFSLDPVSGVGDSNYSSVRKLLLDLKLVLRQDIVGFGTTDKECFSGKDAKFNCVRYKLVVLFRKSFQVKAPGQSFIFGPVQVFSQELNDRCFRNIFFKSILNFLT